MPFCLPFLARPLPTCLSMALLLSSSLSAAIQTAPPVADQSLAAPVNSFVAKNYSYLHDMNGLPSDLIKMHLTLYEGYVKNSNLLQVALRSLDEQGKTRTPEYAGYKRMYGWEYDGMRLHEAYFDQLGGDGLLRPDSSLGQALSAQYGSYEAWKQDFIATGMMRGIGWAVLEYEPISHKFTNAWVNEHDTGHLVGNQPILIMDVFEHAYITKYGLDRAAYIDAFFRNLNWDVSNKRLSQAIKKE